MSTATGASDIEREAALARQTVVVIGGSAGIGLETGRRARGEGGKLILSVADRLSQRACDDLSLKPASLLSRPYLQVFAQAGTAGRSAESGGPMRNIFLPANVALAAALAFSSAARGQAPQRPTKANSPAPTTSPSAAAPVQVPDLSGVWLQRAPASARSYSGYAFMKDEPPMTPWAEAKYHEAKPTFGPKGVAVEDSNSPDYNCLPPGVPYIYFRPHPFEMFQAQGRAIMYFEYDHFVREIFMDGRPHPDDLDPSWMGHAIGHYEGDTLVVDTIGFNDKTWLDRIGHPHSDQLHLVERFRRVDHDTLLDDITIEDPKAYTKPLNAQLTFKLKPEWEIGEFICEEMMYVGHK